MKIMVVDDLEFMRSLIKDILEGAGHTVIGEAGNGRDALFFSKVWDPELIVMDITMPRMNGLEALKKIKNINDRLPVVMCSSLGDYDKILEAIRYGADDYVVKPFKKERLLTAVRKAGERYGL